MTGLSEERLGTLRVAKLRALLGERLHGEESIAAPLGSGAALLDGNGLAAVLIESAGPRSLGGALTWAARQGASALVVVVNADQRTAGSLARQASCFAFDIVILRIVGTTTEPVTPVSAEHVEGPDLSDPSLLDPALRAAIDLLFAHGCEVLVEHGVVKGEILGLEVARVVNDTGAATVEIGIGKFDREISAMMNAALAPAETLRKAVEMVRTYRHPGAAIHPLRDLVPERWLRCLLLGDPHLVGATELRPMDTTVNPASLREAQPAAVVGTLTSGRPVVAVCTAGVDLDIVPLAADTRLAVDPAAELVICGPARNQLRPITAVAELLEVPPRFVGLELPY